MEFEELAYMALKALEPYSRNLIGEYNNGDERFQKKWNDSYKVAQMTITALEAAKWPYADRRIVQDKELRTLIANVPDLLYALQLAEIIAKHYSKAYPHSYHALADLPIISAAFAKVKSVVESKEQKP